MNQVSEHVKKITKQNDELYTTLNRHEQRLTELDNFATREDVGRLIDDIQNSFEVVLNATPRNTNEILTMRTDFQSLRDDIAKIRNEIDSLKRDMKNDPVISSLDADIVEKNISSKPPLAAVKSLNLKKDIILRKNI
jgi:uncharacterized protein YpuA (DUF1002 family)